MRRLRPLAALAIAACSAPSTAPPDTSTAPLVETAKPAPPPAETPKPAPPLPATCAPADPARAAVFLAPRAPRPGEPVRVLAHSEAPLDAAALTILDDTGAEITGTRERRGGPPYTWYAEIPSAAAGRYRAILRAPALTACADFTVAAAAPPAEPRTIAAWTNRAAWDRAAERLYQAFIERLFDAPAGADLAVPALHHLLRDPGRNLLHDYLGRGEDDPGLHAPVIDPDCADLPYFLRAYFAHKLGLPFGYSSCTRGGGGRPPACRKWHSNLEPEPARSSPDAAFVDFLRVKLADTVHSGTGRTPADQDTGDYYPVAITPDSLRPGTVYTDPYGHVLLIAKRIPQTPERGGILYAVDGQPDGTVARRRFWRGNFLFAVDPALGSAGWKRFRPVVTDPRGRARPLTNAEITAHPDYGDLSLTQYEHGVEGFYDAMDDLINPAPLDPARALLEAIDALEEQVKGRVLSVANARKHFAAGGPTIDMPEGPAIFETTGPWEDYSTPSRDLRLLIAVDVVRGFPARVARRPTRFAIPPGQPLPTIQQTLETQLNAELSRRSFTYQRSDGTPFTLTLADILTRAPDLEQAYNPNDCPEVRWAAPPDSEELRTCRRRAPASQRARMRKTRPWFHTRRRPPRL